MNTKIRIGGIFRQLSLLIAVSIVCSIFSAASPAATFLGLGESQPGPYSAWAISGDGSAVVGQTGFGGFLWTLSDGVTNLPLTLATDVSANGSVVVGDGASGGSRWTQAAGVQGLGTLGGPGSSARAISGDGSVIVGFSDTGTTSTDHRQAFRWTEASGMVGLGYLSTANPYNQLSSASGVSHDGSVIVGFSFNGTGNQAFRWTSSTGMVGLTTGPLDEPFYGTPNGISSDGTTIFGQGGWYWKESTGVQYLGTSLSAYAASADGSIIVGGEQFCCSSISFIWDTTHGPRNLKTVLQTDYGLDVTGWTLNAALGISDDGMKIVGVGINPQGIQEAWYADLGATAVPIPASLWLMLSGIVSFAAFGRRRPIISSQA